MPVGSERRPPGSGGVGGMQWGQQALVRSRLVLRGQERRPLRAGGGELHERPRRGLVAILGGHVERGLP